MQRAQRVKNHILEDHNVPKGELTIVALQGIAKYYLSPFLFEFKERYPEINLNVLVKNSLPDFNPGLAYIALYSPILEQKGLVQKHLITNDILLYASPEYLKTYGIPQTPKDLDHHKLIGSGNPSDFPYMDWHLTLGVKKGSSRDPCLSASSPQIRLSMAEQGAGIASISTEYREIDKMNLVRVLPNIKGSVIETYLIYPEYLKTSKRVQAFEDFIMPRFK